MLVFNIFIYSRKGDCLYYEQWNRENSPSPSLAEEQKLLFGVLHSLKSFVSKISPASDDSLKYYKTSTYKLHYFETPSGLKIVLMTDPQAGDLSQYLKEIYHFYVKFCTKNPLYKMGDPIKCDLFSSNLQSLVQKLQKMQATN
mmetsp:Transcript_3581/g.4640  ORF Transcript_3581/g.4640 Transcript_3581/m.4640 type:complete len:143 (-) Transcript_3581:130-558(-)